MTSSYTQLVKNLEYLKLKQMITHLDDVIDFINANCTCYNENAEKFQHGNVEIYTFLM